ncbi:lysozyme inhibitor LprI family protein, partial [Caulobacter sp. 17J65-9]|uniref:lysozyme inhibitor LprI family protein n=1 Tax=Caulobacter sp. 17J65-9 TaxID=2709382 RepID=UPI0013CA314D
QRQVCRNPSLAALDARMDSIYRRALSSARDPRALKADQDRWMAVREGAALRDPSMVGPAYERRIAELSRRDW